MLSQALGRAARHAARRTLHAACALALVALLSPAAPAAARDASAGLVPHVQAALAQTAAFIAATYAYLCGIDPAAAPPRPADDSAPLPEAALLPLATDPGAGGLPRRPALLARYRISGPLPDYELVRYRPRQFAAGANLGVGEASLPVDDAGPYAGWDVLNTPERGPNATLADNEWLGLDLSRPAQLAIVWRAGGPPPAWLRGWQRGPDVAVAGQRAPTYRRAAAAGALSLGAVYGPGEVSADPRAGYLVLLAEADGRPSPAPPVPAGHETPQPNATCPSWVHDQYRALAPDGRTYRTWHPPIDPVYWCYFHHEHGADPGPHQALFGYSASQGGVVESHTGYKVYAFDLPGGERVVLTHHLDAGDAVRAACARYHTFDLAAYRQGALLADIHTLADHGKATHAGDGAPLTPPGCPGQAAEADAASSAGERRLPVVSLDPTAAALWRLDMAATLFAGLGGWSVSVPGRAADCDSLRCAESVPTGDQGEFRVARYPAGFGVAAGADSGAFFTDAFGRARVRDSAPGALRQYLAGGLDLRLPPLPEGHACTSDHPFGGGYRCGPAAPPSPDMNIEGSLR